MPIKDEAMRKVRVKVWIKERVNGLTIDQIAEKYNVHPMTVRRNLSWAKQMDIFMELEDKMMDELMPMAHESLKRALVNEEDGQVALELYKGKNLLKKPGQKITVDQGQTGDDLASYISRLGDMDEDDEWTDGELIAPAEEQKSLPAGRPGEIDGDQAGQAQSGESRSEDRQ